MSGGAPATRCQRWVRLAELWTAGLLLPTAVVYLLHLLSARADPSESAWNVLALALVWAAVLVEYGPTVCPGSLRTHRPPVAEAPSAGTEAAPPPD